MIVSLLLIALAGTFTSCIAYRFGAPTGACSTLLPRHGSFKPQEVSVPYTLKAENLGDKIDVIISSPTAESFKGFILQARSASNRENLIAGEFKPNHLSKGLSCGGKEKSTLTHLNNETKTAILTEWTGVFDEDIIFRATVVKDYETFWTNFDSDIVAAVERETEEKSNVSETLVCEEPKSCFGLPEKCVENGNCEVLLMFKANTDGSIEFSLSGLLNEDKYMAVGISKDNIMGDDFVTECLRVGSTDVKLRKSWNKVAVNVDTVDVSQTGKLSFKDGKTTCTWVEQKVLNFMDKTYDLSHKPYILLAHGDMLKDHKLDYHYKSRIYSSEPITFYAAETVDLKEDDGNKKRMTDKEPDEKQTIEVTSESIKKDETNSCSQLRFSLFWLAVFAVVCASGRIHLI